MSAVEQLASRGRRRRGAEAGSYARQQQEARRALYHCNYCHRDISSTIRIKCAVCQDFDLCLTCFSVGVELSGHRNTHSYRVIDNLGFPLLHPSWGADEELLLLEGIDHYGLGNWLAVSEHVGTKTPDQCQQHYFQAYIDPDSFPLPTIAPELQGVDLAALAAAYKEGRHRKRPASVLEPPAGNQPPPAPSPAAAGGAAEAKVDLAAAGTGGGSWQVPDSGFGSEGGDGLSKEAALKLEEAAVKLETAEREEQQQAAVAGGGAAGHAAKRPRTAAGPSSKTAAAGHATQASKGLAASHQQAGMGLGLPGWGGGEAGPTATPQGPGGEGGEEHVRVRGSGPQLDAATGWHAKRCEFEPEWDQDAEVAIAEIEFRPDDSAEETARKLRMMEIYNKRLDERERRREFIVKYGMLNVRRMQGLERKRLPSEREQYAKLRVFGRFQPPGAHEAFVGGLFTEGRLRNRIKELQAYRAAGLRTWAEVEEWEQQRHKAGKAGGAAGVGAAGGSGVADEGAAGGAYKNPSAALHAWQQRRGVGLDLVGQLGLQLLSAKERELCAAQRVLPAHYLALKDQLMRQGELDGHLSRQEARAMLRLEKSKAVKIYELLMNAGWLPPPAGQADSQRASSHDQGGSSSDEEEQQQQPAAGRQQQQAQQAQQEQQQGEAGADAAVVPAPAGVLP